MSAPAALAFAKLFFPETEKSKTKADSIVIEAPKEANVLDAATQGATSAGLLVVNITAIVVAFIAFMAFLNSIVAFLGDLVGMEGLSFDLILGKIFIPLSFLMGVDWEDCEQVSNSSCTSPLPQTAVSFLSLLIQGPKLLLPMGCVKLGY